MRAIQSGRPVERRGSPTRERTLVGALLLAAFLLVAGCDLSSQIATPASVISPSTTVVPAAHTPAAVSPTPTLMPLAQRKEIFNQVWDTVNDNYLYPDFHGANWRALRDEYDPKVESVSSAEEFYLVIGDMIDQLKDDHSGFISPWEAEAEDKEVAGTGSFVGIGILTVHLDDSLLIVEVFEGSPAWKAGLRRGDHIVSVEGVPATVQNEERLALSGPEGTSVRLTVRSGGKPDREMVIERREVQAKSYPTSTRLSGNLDIGLLTITTFAQEDMDKLVEDALRQLSDQGDLTGLIIDVRGNGGGLSIVLENVLGQFVSGYVGDHPGRPGGHGLPYYDDTAAIRITEGELYGRLRGLPIIVLVDEETASSAEIFAAVLQHSRGARVVGVPTMGNTETIVPYDFDDGSRLWLAEYGFSLPGGSVVEGKGVIPDAIVDADWTNSTPDKDPQLLKAVELIRNPGTRTPQR